jgi:hypothetical protein
MSTAPKRGRPVSHHWHDEERAAARAKKAKAQAEYEGKTFSRLVRVVPDVDLHGTVADLSSLAWLDAAKDVEAGLPSLTEVERAVIVVQIAKRILAHARGDLIHLTTKPKKTKAVQR